MKQLAKQPVAQQVTVRHSIAGQAHATQHSIAQGDTSVTNSRKGGAALIVVISLLGTLAFLGFIFYSFAAQEVASAENFANARSPTVALPPDAFWDWALEQLIVGTPSDLTNSALYGNKYSLIANLLGTPNGDLAPLALDLTWGAALDLTLGAAGVVTGDVRPHDGIGIRTIPHPVNPTDPRRFAFDLDGDGVYTAGTDRLDDNYMVNFSPSADIAGFFPFSYDPASAMPPNWGVAYRAYQPDAGYTYPDLNSMFLGYDATTRGWPDGRSGRTRQPIDYKVIIPSFFRPQLFPARRGANTNAGTDDGLGVIRSVDNTDNGTNPGGFADLYTNIATVRQVLRPHAEHRNSDGSRRYVTPIAGVQAQSGDTNRIIRRFPFFVDLDNDGVPNEFGVWSNPNQHGNPEYDVDADGDGIRDSILLDLDFPLMTMDDGRQFVPIFAVKMIDADSLLNVNVHGNQHGLYVRRANETIELSLNDDVTATNIVGTNSLAESVSFHQSNLGISPSEVNLSMGLTARVRPIFIAAAGSNPQFEEDHVDPAAAFPDAPDNNSVNVRSDIDRVRTQFDIALNYGYNPAGVYGGTNDSPSTPAIANLEALMLLNGRREFELDRNRLPRERRELLLGRHGDSFKVRELYLRLAQAAGLPIVDGNLIPGPLPGGYNLDDDGDSNLLGFAPFFGGSGDDDQDAPGSQQRRDGGAAFTDAALFGVQVPPFVHPLDYLGAGRDYLDLAGATPIPLGRLLGQPITTASMAGIDNPSQWPSYNWIDTATMNQALSLWQHQLHPTEFPTPDVDRTGVAPWYSAQLDLGSTGQLQAHNTLNDFLIDEPDEVIVEPSYQNPEYDALFPSYEMEGLHLSASHYSKVQGASRLRELASINFDRILEQFAGTIRRRFTTDSWDRLEPSLLGRSYNGTANETILRPWEDSVWNNGAPGMEDFNTSNEAFPPEFGVVDAGSANDPFRRELRLLLKSEWRYTGGITGESFRYPSQKFNINRLLSNSLDMTGGVDRRAFDGDGNPMFRNLTPHPIFVSTDPPIATMPGMLHNNVDPGDEHTPSGINDADVEFVNMDPTNVDPAQQKKAQEWWARYDRQRMARDIYVMLYLLGAPDGVDPTDTAVTAYPVTATTDLYDFRPRLGGGVRDFNSANGINDQLEMMAQFAVNYVDALDRDDVLTKFVYDTNLADGWSSLSTAGDMQVVNGVEAQQLTFSEVLWVQTADEGAGNDDAETSWDDEESRNFLYIELRNMRPFDVPLDSDSWKIARLNAAGDAEAASFEFVESPTFTDDRVLAGKTYLIACHDNTDLAGGNPRSSDMYANLDATATDLEAVVPFRQPTSINAGANPAPTADLDLSYVNAGTDDTNRFNITPLGAGTLVDAGTDNGNLTPFTLVLQRRRHLRTAGVITTNPDNDWVEVDRITVDPATPTAWDFTGTAADINALQSTERTQPLVRSVTSTNANDGAATNPAYGERRHTFGFTDFTLAGRNTSAWVSGSTNSRDRNQENSTLTVAGTSVFDVWQPHFDRDFSSVYELLSVPVMRPDDLTDRLTDLNQKLSGADGTTAAPTVAGGLFTLPDNGTPGTTSPNSDDDQRWYRLLELLSVPTRAEESIRDRVGDIARTPGKINLNTIRHEAVLAALIDDPILQGLASFPGRLADIVGAFSSSSGFPNFVDGRNFMDELQLARDGVDPINFDPTLAPIEQTSIPLPGVPGRPGDVSINTPPYPASGQPQLGSLPFRGLGYIDPTYSDQAAHTILRKNILPVGTSIEAETINREGGLEQLGLFEARPQSDFGTDNYDYHTRDRLLSKVANNSTQRSNVFLCWIVVEFYEAHQPNAADPTIVQVGAKLEGSPTHRGFFVIDRTRLEQAVDLDSVVDTLSDNTGSPNDTDDDTFRFDWRDFVIHRRTIQ